MGIRLLLLLCLYTSYTVGSSVQSSPMPIPLDLLVASYTQGHVTDALICYFNKAVVSTVYEPCIQKLNQKSSRATFFVPFFGKLTKTACRKLTMLKKAHNYNLRCIPVTQPVAGLTIQLTYTQEKIGWHYYTVHNKQTGCTGLLFLLHDKAAIAQLSNKYTGPLRWYAQAKHQPRIVLDALYNNPKTRQFIKLFQAILVRQGYEVFTTQTTCSAIAHDTRISYAQLGVQADVFLSLGCGAPSALRTAQQRVYTQDNSMRYILRQSTLTCGQHRKLEQLNTCKRARSHVLACCLRRHMSAYRVCDALYTPEMPAVSVSLQMAKRKHAYALAHALKHYFCRYL